MINRDEKIILTGFFFESGLIFWAMLECNRAGLPNISLFLFLLWFFFDIIFLRGMNHVK